MWYILYLNLGSVEGVPLQTEPDEETSGRGSWMGPMGMYPSGSAGDPDPTSASSTHVDEVRE